MLETLPSQVGEVRERLGDQEVPMSLCTGPNTTEFVLLSVAGVRRRVGHRRGRADEGQRESVVTHQNIVPYYCPSGEHLLGL